MQTLKELICVSGILPSSGHTLVNNTDMMSVRPQRIYQQGDQHEANIVSNQGQEVLSRKNTAGA